MFHDIPEAVQVRMAALKERGVRDRADGTPRLQRLREVPLEVGRFLAILAAGAPEGRWVEIGTSAGYSTLWLALAAREVGARVTTFEILEWKVELARETFAVAEVEDVVELVHADVRAGLAGRRRRLLRVPRLGEGGLPRAVRARRAQAGARRAAGRRQRHRLPRRGDSRCSTAPRDDERVDAVVVPFLTGQLLARRRP